MLTTLFNRLFELLIPEALRHDEVQHTKAKNLVGLGVLGLLAAPPFTALHAWLGNSTAAIANALSLPMLVIALVTLRMSASMLVPQYLSMFTLYGLFSAISYSLGGTFSSAVDAWFVTVPVTATFVLGLRQGILWLGLTLAAVAFFIWASLTGAVSFPPNPVQNMKLLNFISTLALIACLAGVAMFFQLAKDQSDDIRRTQVETIRLLMKEVGSQTREVSGRVQQMVGALHEQSQQAMAMRAASDGNRELAASLQTTSATLAQEADQARATAEQGANVVASAIANTDSLADSINQADKLVQAMQSRSQEIGGIVDRIKNLAFQTNILALNATIEAAHAGEHGRGFAVVADNVRKLAGEAGEATTTISTELGVMLSQIRSTAQLLDNSQKLADCGQASAAQAKHALQTIQDSVRNLHREMSQLAQVSRRQVDRNGELQAVASRMEAGIQQVASGSSSIEQAMSQLHSRLATLSA